MKDRITELANICHQIGNKNLVFRKVFLPSYKEHGLNGQVSPTV